jgi:hypothetical protein
MEKKQPPLPADEPKPADPRPPYEPPRVTKKRSVSRATLFSGGGVPSTGITGAPP